MKFVSTDLTRKTAIPHVEIKTDGLRGIGRIVRVRYSRSGRTIDWDNRRLIGLGGFAAKANYCDEDTWEEFWISTPRRDGKDSLLPAVIEIDADVREEYWTAIRGESSQRQRSHCRSAGRTKRERERLEKSVRRHDVDRRFRAPESLFARRLETRQVPARVLGGGFRVAVFEIVSKG